MSQCLTKPNNKCLTTETLTSGRSLRRGRGSSKPSGGLRPSHQPHLPAAQGHGDARHARMGHRMGGPQAGLIS